MKLLIVGIALICFSNKSFCQDSSWIFSKTIILDSVNQNTIFSVANEWFVNHGLTKNREFILESSIGKMTGVGHYAAIIKGGIAGKDKGTISYTFLFLAKDGKCKVEFSNFSQALIMANGGSLSNDKPACGNFAITQKTWEAIKDLARNNTNNLINDFEKTMLKLTQKQYNF